jgi:hypothetical protein
MNQQFDSIPGPPDHANLDKRLAVVESNYASKDVLVKAQLDMRGWFVVQTLTLAIFTGGYFTYTVDRLVEVDQRLDQVEMKLVKLEARMEKLEVRIDNLEIRMGAIENQLKEIQVYMQANPRR